MVVGRRGQISTETLAILGFSGLLLLALISFVYPKVANYYNYLEISSAEASLTKLANAVNEVAAYGPGSKTELELYFPEGTLEIGSNTLSFKSPINGGTYIVKRIPKKVSLIGNAGFKGGNYHFTISYDDEIEIEKN